MESTEKVECSDIQLSITIEQDAVKTDELSSTDLVALDEHLKSIKSANQNAVNFDTREIEHWRSKLPQLYSSFYDTSIYTVIEENRFLLSYFMELKDNDKHKELYESLSKVFIAAQKIREAIQDIKILHANLNSKLSEIKSRIVLLAPTFKQAVAQTYQNKTTKKNAFIKQLRLIEPAQIKQCQEFIDDLKLKQKDLKALYTYTHKDRENLVQILGCGMTQLALDPNLEINLKTLKKAVDDNRKVLDSIQEQIHENEKLKNIELAKMEYLMKVIENNQKEIRLLDQELDNLKDNVTQNMAKKKEILDFYTDSKRLNSKRSERENLRNELNQQYTKLIVKTNEENNKIIDEIKKIKDVAKHFHLIFIIDESGSMSGGPYDQVMSSVKKVIEIRKALPLTKDKMSLIKFNTEANVEILNKSVNDEFKPSEMRGGDTTFVKPLECLVEILRDIDFDVEIPIVMFLSDGQGESTQTVLDFINKKILNDPAIGSYCSNNENMLFFTIGYGDEADKETLEKMAKAFNKGKSFTSIGKEKLQLYHHVTNENQLVGVFTVYQKIFAFKKNILDTKRDMLDQNLAHAVQANSRNSKVLDELYAREDEEIKREETRSKLVGADIEAINNVYNERIEKCKSLRQALLETNKANSEEYKNCEKKLEDLENKILAGKTEYNHEQVKFDNVEKDYKDFIDQCSKFNADLIESFKKDEAFVNLIENLKNKYGIKITKTQKIHFKNHLIKFLKEFKDLIDDSIKLEDRSNNITIEYNLVVSRFKNMDDLLNIFADLTNKETIKSKIWAMFVYRYYDKDIKIRSKVEKMSDTEKKEVLWKILFGKQSKFIKQETKKKKTTQDNQNKQDSTDDDVYHQVLVEEENDKEDNSSSSEDEDDDHYYLRKAFNSIFSLISVEEFFVRNENEEDFCDKFIDIYLLKIQKNIDDIKELKRHAKNDKNEIKQLDNEIDKNYEEKNKMNEFKSEKLKILGLIKEKIKALKEDYFQARVVYELENIFISIRDEYIPRVEALESVQQQVSMRTIQN